jgi:hypothetical protein
VVDALGHLWSWPRRPRRGRRAGLVGWRNTTPPARPASAAYSAALAKIGQDNAARPAELSKQAQSARAVPLARRAGGRPAARQAERAGRRPRGAGAKLPPELSDLALVIAGFRSVDIGKLDGLLPKLEPLAQTERPFHASVIELQALAAARKGDLKKARELWTPSPRIRGAAGRPAACPGDAHLLRRTEGK